MNKAENKTFKIEIESQTPPSLSGTMALYSYNVVMCVVIVGVLFLFWNAKNLRFYSSQAHGKGNAEKRLIHLTNNNVQEVSVWDERDDSNEMWRRAFYNNGRIQSTSKDEHKYHESLVHPAMLAHKTGATRVAILGVGGGAILREVLKYRSVEYVEVYENDPQVIEVAREHLLQYHNCSFLSKRVSSPSSRLFFSCFDDARVEIVYQDAIKDFRNRAKGGCVDKLTATDNGETEKQSERTRSLRKRMLLKDQETKKSDEDDDDDDDDDRVNMMDNPEGFDVIIVDIDSATPHIYSKNTLASFVCGLRKYGVLVMQV